MTDKAVEHKRRMKAQKLLQEFTEPRQNGEAKIIVRLIDLIALGLKVEDARHASKKESK